MLIQKYVEYVNKSKNFNVRHFIYLSNGYHIINIVMHNYISFENCFHSAAAVVGAAVVVVVPVIMNHIFIHTYICVLNIRLNGMVWFRK